MAMTGFAGRDAARTRATALGVLLLCVVALVAGWSRLWPPAVLLRPCGDVLRWREALSMLVFAALIVLQLWRLFVTASDGRIDGWAYVFVGGVYFLGVGMGMHDVCNRLGQVYRGAPEAVTASLDFFDNKLGHWVFFAGFMLTSVAGGVQQLRHPLGTDLPWCWSAGLVGLSLPLMFVMLTNLMFEKTGLDLGVIAVVTLTIGAAQVRYRVGFRRLPLLCVLYPAYTVAVAGSLLYWLMG